MSEAMDRRAVEATVRDVYDAIADADAERLDDHFDREDVFAFGRRADSRHDSWATISAEHAEEFRHVRRITMTGTELRVSVSGDVAWVSDRIHQRVETVDGRSGESDGRLTAVLRRTPTDGSWRIVQFHASAGL